MRSAGEIEGARGFGLSDHLCWVYEEPPDFVGRVVEFLDDGLTLGQRVCYAAVGDHDRLLGDLRGLSRLDEAVRSGALQVLSRVGGAADGRTVDLATHVGEYADLTRRAIADGYTGLRVAAEMTRQVGTPARLEAFARYEHLVDRFMNHHPFAAMCAYDRRALGDRFVAQLACLHPNTSYGSAQFRLHASPRSAATLAGEIDINTRDLFPLALEHADLRPTGGELVVDAPELTFIDHRSLIVLGEFAARRNAVAVLRTAYPGAARIVEVLGLTDIRIEPPP